MNTDTKNLNEMERFSAGDIVICLRSIQFADGSKHIKGQRYIVMPESEAYYNVCNADYKLSFYELSENDIPNN